MTIAPGTDCIQGLRWSTMQIYNVSVAEKPTSGHLVLVGPGFRYFARSDFTGTDSFALVVVGKKRHNIGTSTVRVMISRQDPKPISSRASIAAVLPVEPVLISAVNHFRMTAGLPLRPEAQIPSNLRPRRMRRPGRG